MNEESERRLLAESKAALRRGDRALARRIAQQVVSENFNALEGWLILAGLSSPKASLAYLEIAQGLAPDDPRIKSALKWSRQRIAAATPGIEAEATREIRGAEMRPAPQIRPPIMMETHRPVWLWTLVGLALMAILLLGLDMIPSGFVRAAEQAAPIQMENFNKPSLTPTSTNTPTPTPTPTNTPTSTPTSTPTNTPTSTPTATPTATATSIPTQRPTNTQVPFIPPDVDEGERWIDIDLSEQRLYAYEGDTIVRSFLVSTGLPNTPTPVGRFAVWIKLRYDDMSGPGYYLPNVPYTMYFYKDYGIHGTYWHSNFGTPMSHGCVNMITEEAGWLFNWSHVGIVVNVHE
jgi:hypothetical protein